MTEIRTWAGDWGDIASVIGLMLAIVGFAVTFVGVWRSQRAAEQARQAANAAWESIASYNVVVDLSSAMAIMDEIKRHQRLQSWAVLPDRYSELRRRLVVIRESQAQLSNEHRQVLQRAIEEFAGLERRVERAVVQTGAPPRPDKLNDIVSAQIDEVHAVLLALQRTLRSER